MERGKPHLLTLRRCHTPFVSPAELRVGTETDKRKEAHAALICWANTVTTVPLLLLPLPFSTAGSEKQFA